jgi:ABC-2 type transport system ATP-binding protein
VKTGEDNPVPWLGNLPGVKEVQAIEEDGWRSCAIRIEANTDLREEIYRLAVERNWTVRELSRDRATLEDVFVELTQTDT